MKTDNIRTKPLYLTCPENRRGGHQEVNHQPSIVTILDSCRALDSAVVRQSRNRHDIGSRLKRNLRLDSTSVQCFHVRDYYSGRESPLQFSHGSHAFAFDKRGSSLHPFYPSSICGSRDPQCILHPDEIQGNLNFGPISVPRPLLCHHTGSADVLQSCYEVSCRSITMWIETSTVTPTSQTWRPELNPFKHRPNLEFWMR